MLSFADTITIHTLIENQRGKYNVIIKHLLNHMRAMIVYSISYIYILPLDKFELMYLF